MTDKLDVEALVGRLRRSAQSTSSVSKMMAESKSLRQGDGTRDDLYAWQVVEQTTEWKAADALEALSAHIAGEDARLAAAVAGATAWQPIETAPRGTNIILWVETDDGDGWLKFGKLGGVEPPNLVTYEGDVYFPHENGGWFAQWRPFPTPPTAIRETPSAE